MSFRENIATRHDVGQWTRSGIEVGCAWKLKLKIKTHILLLLIAAVRKYNKSPWSAGQRRKRTRYLRCKGDWKVDSVCVSGWDWDRDWARLAKSNNYEYTTKTCENVNQLVNKGENQQQQTYKSFPDSRNRQAAKNDALCVKGALPEYGA